MDHNMAIIMGALFAISEALSLIPAIKANGLFQLVSNVIKAMLPKG